MGWFLLCATLSVTASATDLVQFDRTQLFLDPGEGRTVALTVELATTPRQHAQGLMFREYMSPDEGMLFIFSQDGQRSFWMKNTLIPLDMLFFDASGAFVSVIENAEPESLTPRRSDGAAKFVLEVNAGTSARLGIGKGSRLILPITGVSNRP